MHLFVKTAVVGILFASSIHAANADNIDALTLLGNYNLITSGNVTSYSEVDGNALIGGNLAGNSNYHIHNTSTAVSALTVAGNIVAGANVQVNGPGLIVGGSIFGSVTMNGAGDAYVGSVANGGSLQNNANGNGSTNVVGDIAGTVNTNGGNTIYGGNLTGSANANGGGSVLNQTVTPPVDAVSKTADAIFALTEFSDVLGTLDSNSSYSFSGNKVTFDAIGNSDGLAIFTITDANNFFSNASEFEFNVASGTQDILFNVINSDANSTLNIHANFLSSAATTWGSKMLWNFENATSIALSAQFGGSLLALNANTTTSANIEGTLVAKSLVQGAEIHSQPLDPGFTAPAAVPLPAAAPLFLTALAGLGAITRRNRKTIA